MTYLVLDAVFVVIAGGVLLVARWRIRLTTDVAPGGRTPRTRPSGVAIAWTGVVLAVTTAVFDNLMIAAGLVAYDDEHLVGLYLGRAPVEDFGYPLAAAMLLPALWHLLGAPGARAGIMTAPAVTP